MTDNRRKLDQIDGKIFRIVTSPAVAAPLPVPYRTSVPALRRKTMAATDPIDVQFKHPTDSTKTFDVTITPDATPAFLIDALIKEGFMPAAATGERYDLRRLDTGQTLLPDVTLAAANVGTGATINVHPTYTGA
jgi:hypothetical protein